MKYTANEKLNAIAMQLDYLGLDFAADVINNKLILPAQDGSCILARVENDKIIWVADLKTPYPYD